MAFKAGKYAFIAANRMLSYRSIYELAEGDDVVEARVNSTCLVRARLDKETNEMILDFTDGTSYLYSGVGEDDFENLRDAASKGQHFNYSLRDQFPYERIS